MPQMKAVLIVVLLVCFLPACAPQSQQAAPTSAPLPRSTTSLTPTVLPTQTGPASSRPRAVDTPELKERVEMAEPVLTPGPPELNRFTIQLSQALESRDFETLRGLMGARFILAEWQGNRQDLSPIQAEQSLKDGALAEGSKPAVFLGQDVVALLGGSDPFTLLDPKGNNLRAFALSGLGATAESQGVAVIGFDATKGNLFWRGLLVAPLSFPRTPVAAYPPDFTSARAKTTLDLRAGPGADSSLLGQVSAGTLLQVFAKSVDGSWLEVICAQEITGHCWVPADPALVEPVK